MMNVMTGTYIRGEENFNFNFYTNLSAVKKLEFVNSVVDVLVNGGNYNSVIRDLVFDFFVVDIFTDIDISEIVETDFVDNAEQFLEKTNVVEIVKTNVEDGLIDELNNAIDLDIQYKTGIHPNLFGEALAKLINTLEKKINEVDSNNMIDMAQKISGMSEDFSLENLVNAYMNSDIHKENLVEIAKVKGEK